MLRTSSLARNAGWMFAGQGASVLLQAAYFILLAHLLGVRQYGIFAGAFALVGILGPYCTLGSGTVFMRYAGSQPEKFPLYWGNILLSTGLASGASIVLLYFLAPHLIDAESASIVLTVAVGNCLFSQMLSAMGQVFQAYELLGMTAFLNLLTNALRTIAVGVMALLFSRITAGQWALVSAVVSLLAALTGFLIISRRFGLPRFHLQMVFANAFEGLGFSLGGSAQSVYNDLDKTMLSHYGMNVQNGIYTMAYRIIDIGTLPVSSIDAASLPRYFRAASENLPSVPALAFRLAKRAFFIGLVVSAVLFLSAPVVPHIVGHGYAESIQALRWLCLLPAIRGIHQLTGSAMTGMGFQRFRTIIQFSAAGSNLLLNLWLIPKHGWQGAAWSSLATDGALAVINCLMLMWVRKAVCRLRSTAPLG